MSELQADPPITVAGITLIPIAKVRIESERRTHACRFGVVKEAVAVVICEAGSVRVVDVEAQERSLDELIAQVPGLKRRLGSALSP